MNARNIVLMALCLGAALLLAACVGALPFVRTQGALSAAQVAVTGHDHRFEAPNELPAGRVSLTFHNQGREPHHAQVARLNEGVTHEQVAQAAQQGLAAVMQLVTFYGGPSNAEANGAAQATLDLVPGEHVFLCFIPGPDGVAHMAKGMLAPFSVRAEPAATEIVTPTAQQTVSLYDFHYSMPERIAAGRQTWQVVNDGPQVHELALFKLAPGKTVDDFLAFQRNPTGPPPFEHVGGMQFLEPGMTGWIDLDLTPGNYVANCFVPDPASGQPHMALGMVMPFSVYEE